MRDHGQDVRTMGTVGGRYSGTMDRVDGASGWKRGKYEGKRGTEKGIIYDDRKDILWRRSGQKTGRALGRRRTHVFFNKVGICGRKHGIPYRKNGNLITPDVELACDFHRTEI